MAEKTEAVSGYDPQEEVDTNETAEETTEQEESFLDTVAIPQEIYGLFTNKKFIARIVAYIIVAINGIIAYFGGEFQFNFSDNQVYEIGTFILTAGTAIHAFFKNQPLTKRGRLKEEVGEEAAKKTDASTKPVAKK